MSGARPGVLTRPSQLRAPHLKLCGRLLTGCAASWRKPIGESGLLDFFLEVVGNKGVRQTITTQALRIIGNSCADTGAAPLSYP
jgi:hypothetical protein